MSIIKMKIKAIQRYRHYMKKVLIVDFSTHKKLLNEIYSKKGYEVTECESAFDAMSKLNAYNFDLVVSEVELPGDNAFDLYNYLNDKYPYIPAIMTTDKKIDNFFYSIFRQGIGNVMSKPINAEEILNLSEKLITRKNIFGLKNYIDDITDLKKIRISRSAQIQKAINILIGHLKEWGFEIKNRMVLNLMLNEMIINAVYHSHGFTREKLERKPVTLNEGEHVDIFFGRNASRYGISIVDYKGILSKEKILESINSAIEQDMLLERAAETGEDITELVSETGRGIDIVRKMAVEYYFIIKKNLKTEIILLFDPAHDEEGKSSSLKIIEDIPQ